MIPFYLNLRDLHLTNSLWGIIIPFMVSTYNMIILRTSFEAIPESLTEAAKIDGAGHITILVRIVLPLSKAILAVMVLYYGVSIWNGWFWASAILRDRDKYPLQLILREILLSNDSQAMSSGAGGDAEALSQDDQIRDDHGGYGPDPVRISFPAEVFCDRRYDRRSKGVIIQ